MKMIPASKPRSSLFSWGNFLKIQGFSLLSILIFIYVYCMLFFVYDCYTVDVGANPIHAQQDLFARSLSSLLDSFLNPGIFILWFFILMKVTSRRSWKEIIFLGLFIPVTLALLFVSLGFIPL